MNLVYFIACHGGPAAHFSEFAKELKQVGYQVEMIVTGPAYDKLRHLGAKEFNPAKLDIDNPEAQQLLALQTARSLRPSATIITDVGHSIMVRLQEAIAKEAPTIRRFAYYDNPEPFVPGGYSATAKKVMACADKVLFSNANLVKETLYAAPGTPLSLPREKKIGLGYYPLEAAKFLESARAARHEIARRLFFDAHKRVDRGEKILVYLGGNNEVYFEKAFPAFLRLQKGLDRSQYILILQQHPGAKAKGIDLNLAKEAPLYVSEMSSEEALVLADAALYYQTSMGPQIVLAGIPAIQVGHETYPDILVRNGLAPSATTKKTFIEAIKASAKPPRSAKLLDDLGIAKNWQERLKQSLEGIAKLHSGANSRSLRRIRFFENRLRPKRLCRFSKNRTAFAIIKFALRSEFCNSLFRITDSL